MTRTHFRTLLTLVLSSVVVGVGGCGEEVGERAANTETRIVGGQQLSGLPSVVALTYDGRHHCTGTVVERRKVLTAAHCLAGFSASRMRVMVGASIYQPEAVLRVASLAPHPQYSSYSQRNDIGLVYLAQDAPVAPLPVLPKMDASWRGRPLLFVGYGVSNGYSGSGAGTKRAVWMNVSGVDAASFSYADPGKNTCGGDSGGPALYRDADGDYYVAGVTSYGDQYCVQYGVDTRADVYRAALGLSTAPAPNVPTPSAPATPATSADPCGGETFAGRCDGATVIWCEQGRVNQLDCAARYGRGCGWSASNSYYGCI